jgi:hypothetical protein
MILVISVESCWFHNVSLSYFSNFSPHSDGLITKWMASEPTLNEEDQCVVLILHNTVDGGAEVHAKLDKCGKAVHNFVCVTYPCLNQDVKCWGQSTNVHKKMGQEHGILLSPELEIR